MSFGATVEIMKFYAMYKKSLINNCSKRFKTMPNVNITKLIMVIELSGVQFRLKSLA